jgi:hypothetical protein
MTIHIHIFHDGEGTITKALTAYFEHSGVYPFTVPENPQ